MFDITGVKKMTGIYIIIKIKHMSIWRFLFHILRKTKIVPYIIVAIIIIFGLAYTIFQQSLLMQSDLDVYSTITKLIYYTII